MGGSTSIVTKLEGNISISSWAEYANSNSTYSTESHLYWGSGVRVAWVGNTDSRAELKTVSETDTIRIDVYRFTSAGVLSECTAGSRIILDGTSSTQEHGIIINLHNSSTIPVSSGKSAYETAGIVSFQAGTVDVRGNALITTAQERGYGMWAHNNASIITTGNLDIETTGKGSYGIRGGTNGNIDIDGNLSISTSGAASTGTTSYGASGIRMDDNSSIDVTGSTAITTRGGIGKRTVRLRNGNDHHKSNRYRNLRK